MSVLTGFVLGVCIVLGLGFIFSFYLARSSTLIPNSWKQIIFEIRWTILLNRHILEDFYLRKINQVGEQSSGKINA